MAPSAQIDYNALAAQAGAINSSAPAGSPPTAQPSNGANVDYAAMAKQAGAISSTPPPGQQPQDSLGSRIWSGVKDSSLGALYNTAIAPPQNSTEAHVSMIAGPQALTMYRGAKNIVATAESAMKQTGDKYTQAVQDFARMAQDYQNRDYRNLASDVVSSAADVSDPTGRVRELSEGARPGGNLATPVTKDVIDTGTAALGGEAASDAEGAEATEAATSKSNFLQKALSGEKIAQKPAQGALRGAANAAATDTGATAATASQPVRTLLDQPIGTLGKTERAAYQSINDAAETDLKSLYDYRADLQDALEDPTNITNRQKLNDELSQTESQIQDGEAKAAANGVSPDALDQAKGMTQQRYALQDVKKQLFNNESVISGNARYGTDEQINVGAAIKNLEKLDKPSRFAPEGSPSRLRQALGDDTADQLLSNLYAAQKAGEQAVTARKIAGWMAAGVPIAGGTVELVKKATGN